MILLVIYVTVIITVYNASITNTNKIESLTISYKLAK